MGEFSVTGVEEEAADNALLKKAIDLFTFLGHEEQLLAKPVRATDQCEKVIGLDVLQCR